MHCKKRKGRKLSFPTVPPCDFFASHVDRFSKLHFTISLNDIVKVRPTKPPLSLFTCLNVNECDVCFNGLF